MIDNFDKLMSEIDAGIRPDLNFDIIKREMVVANRRAVMYFIDGFIKDEIYEKMIEYWLKMKPEELNGIDDASKFKISHLPYVEVDCAYEVSEIKTALLSGPTILIIEGITGALVIDTRTYPMRGIEEPQKDKSLRGSRDGFVEALIMNTALIRRRIRDERLRMEYMQIGKRTKLDIAISYIDGMADEKTLNKIRKRLANIDINGISMTQQILSEKIIKSAFFNPFPKFRFSERPDYTSACILDGKIVIVMDNSPSVIILPVSIGDFFRETNDYYFLPITGSYIRITRFIIALFLVLGSPLYLLLTNHPQYVPKWLEFLTPTINGAVPLFIQFLILEFIIDGLKLASVNTPDTLSNSLGIIGGLLLSEFAIDAGWFVTEAVLITAFVAIAGFSQPSFEIGYALKFVRLSLLIIVQLFDLWGLIAGIVVIIIGLLGIKTVSGNNYLYPFIPLNPRALAGLFVRKPVNKDH